jgi:hypothetical protein
VPPQGAHKVDRPLHLQVSAASAPARAAVEAAGGSVTAVYYNRLGLRALLKVRAVQGRVDTSARMCGCVGVWVHVCVYLRTGVCVCV